MGTTQHLILFEHITGLALFRVKEFDEITKTFTAHPNAFIKTRAFIHFKSVEEAIENIQSVSDGKVSNLIAQFLRTNVPTKDCILGVADEKIGKAIMAMDFGFNCVWHGAIREIMRIIRQNFVRLTRSLITQPGAAFSLAVDNSKKRPSTTIEELTPGHIVESRARLVVGLTRARLQLNLQQYLADAAIKKALLLIDDLDTNLTRSASRLRACYSLHFPEVCQPHFEKAICLDDMKLLNLISNYPTRSMIISAFSTGLLSTCLADVQLSSRVSTAARDSIGTQISSDDCENLRLYAKRLLKLIETREHHVQSLARRISILCPNLRALLDSTLHKDLENASTTNLKVGENLSACLVAARLIVNAGSLNHLASMPSTRVLSLGASKSLFRKSGAVVATSSGLLATASRSVMCTSNEIDQHKALPSVTNLSAQKLKSVSANRVQPDTVRRKAARLIAAKCSLASRADCFRYHNPVGEKLEVSEYSSSSKLEFVGDERLSNGSYGYHLGQVIHNQLRTWAETNGVHINHTEEQLKVQRERRKRYRKAKRKAWLVRKLSKSMSHYSQSASSPGANLVKENSIESQLNLHPVSMLVDNDDQLNKASQKSILCTPMDIGSDLDNESLVKSQCHSQPKRKFVRIKARQLVTTET